MHQHLFVNTQTVDFNFRGINLTASLTRNYNSEGGITYEDIEIYYECPQRRVSTLIYDECLANFWDYITMPEDCIDV